MKEYRPRLTEEEMLFIKHRRSGETEENILVIGDLHEPFCLEEYFDFCLENYYKYNCNKVVFIGDVIDNHFSSYHDTDPDGLSAGDELEFAIKRLKKWHDAFPNAWVTIGNHDRLMMRKAYSAGLSKRWIRDYKDVLECPTWKFVDEVEFNEVLYIHGEGGQARARIKNEMQSIVQGHIHTAAHVEWSVGAKYKVFGMQVGCGIDRHSYAMAYGKNFKKPVISCGVVLNDGKLPIVLPMDL